LQLLRIQHSVCVYTSRRSVSKDSFCDSRVRTVWSREAELPFRWPLHCRPNVFCIIIGDDLWGIFSLSCSHGALIARGSSSIGVCNWTHCDCFTCATCGYIYQVGYACGLLAAAIASLIHYHRRLHAFVMRLLQHNTKQNCKKRKSWNKK